jgi:hypothetical protein
VNYGNDLEELTRRSRISLHIAPFSWLHQRVMDGIVAGGFFLMRKHPSNFVPYALHRVIQQIDRGESIDPAKVESLVNSYRRLNEISDSSEHIRQLASMKALHELPLLDQISFADEADCKRLIGQFARSNELAAHTANTQRQYVLDHFTYESQMRRIVGQMTELIRKEAA